MLNLSPQNKSRLNVTSLNSISRVENKQSSQRLIKVVLVLVAILLLVLILPWTQNIRSNGNIITLRPEQRPQMIQSIIAGRIEKWFVKDGDQVKKGDTILFLSEIKESYLDPNLVGRTEKQLKNKELYVASYGDKIVSLDNRIDALIETINLKIT
jgi:multidrug resistance efflux pump